MRLIITFQISYPLMQERLSIISKWLRTESIVVVCEIMLTDEHITKFRNLYKKRFGKDISWEEAYEKGIKLIHMVELIYKPMTKEEFNKLQEHRKKTGDT